MKEGIKNFVKFIVLAVLANLEILQIPIMSVRFQEYLCDEITTNEHAFKKLKLTLSLIIDRSLLYCCPINAGHHILSSF